MRLTSPRALLLGTLALAITLAALAAGAERAGAGLVSSAKKGTASALKDREMEPVRVRCRNIGKKLAGGALCAWVAAERSRAKSLACRGKSELPSKRADLRLKQSGCKLDRGGTELTKSMPDRLRKKGFEAVDAFCWGLLGRGFRCRFEAIRFAAKTYQCRGLATQKRKRFKIRKPGCAVDQEATAAQNSVTAELAKQGLAAELVHCRSGSGAWVCDWRASEPSGGWTYHCTGSARAEDALGPFDFDACRLRAPDRSPVGNLNPSLRFGVNEAWGSFSGQIPRASAIGSNTLRTTLTWASVEHSPGKYYWEFFDQVYSRMLGSGVKPLFIVMGAPCWATGKARCSTSEATNPPAPAHDGAWRTFVAEVAQRYPQAAGIEVWNEPNYDAFYAGGPDPNRYARLLNLASDGVDSVGSKLPVVSGGLAAFTKNRGGEMRYDTFLRKVFKAGGAQRADAIGHHAYSGRRLKHGHVDGLRVQLADLKDVMVDFGRRDAPLWITEMGVSTASKGVDEREQAKTNVKAYKTLARTPGVDAVIVHRWRDHGRRGAESGYGLTTRKGKAKETLCSLAKARGRSCPA